MKMRKAAVMYKSYNEKEKVKEGNKECCYGSNWQEAPTCAPETRLWEFLSSDPNALYGQVRKPGAITPSIDKVEIVVFVS